MGREADGRRWIRNTVTDWQTDNFPFWSERTIMRIIAGLEEKGLLVTRNDLNIHKYDRTKWYAIDYNAFNDLTVKNSNCNMTSCQGRIRQDDSKGNDNVSVTIPETTSKTTIKEYSEREQVPSLFSPSSENAILIWTEVTGLKAKKPQESSINRFVETLTDFNPELWRHSIESATGGGNPANIEAICNTYQYGEGDYGKWMKLRRDAENSGFESVPEMLAIYGNGQPWYAEEEVRLISL